MPQKSNIGYDGEIKYIVSKSWWNSWVDYSNFDPGSEESRSGDEYKRPGMIVNKHLTSKRDNFKLRTNVIEDHDYVVLPAPVWSLLYAWYEADMSMPRVLKRD